MAVTRRGLTLSCSVVGALAASLASAQDAPTNRLENALVQLAERDFATRRQAVRELEALGAEAVPALLRVAKGLAGDPPVLDTEEPIRWPGAVGRREIQETFDSPRVLLPRVLVGAPSVAAPADAIHHEEDLAWPPRSRRAIAVYAIGRIGAAAGGEAARELLALLDAPGPLARQAACSLARLGESALAPVLEALRADPEDVTLVWIAARLGPAASSRLVELLRSGEPALRTAAARALGAATAVDEAAIEALVAALGSRDQRLRQEAAGALDRHAEAAIPHLVTALRSDPAEDLRYAATGLLAHFGAGDAPGRKTRELPASAAEPLIARLEEAGDGQLLHWTGLALAHTSLSAEQHEHVVERLLELAGHRYARIRLATALHLGSFGPASRKAVPRILELLEGRRSFRNAAVVALWELGEVPEAALPALVAVAREHEGWASGAVPALAVSLLALAGDAGLTAVVEVAGESENASVFGWAVRRGLLARGTHGVEAALGLVGHPESWVRAAAGEVLAEADDENAMTALRRLADDPEVRVRSAVAGALDARRAAPVLIDLLGDPDAGTRESAARSLRTADLGDGSVRAALIAALRDPEARVRRAAVAALGDPAADRSAVEALVETLADDDLRRTGLRALASIGPGAAPAVPALLELLEHDDVFVRADAGAALRAIEGR